MTQILDGGELEETDFQSQPRPTEVLIPEVRQRTRLRRLRNVSALLVVAVLAIGYFTVIHRPASPKPSSLTAAGTLTSAVLANTNADVVSFRRSAFHPDFTLSPGSPVLQERGWALGNGRDNVIDDVIPNGTVVSASSEVLSIVGHELSLVTTTVNYTTHEWMQSRRLTACAIACSQFVLTSSLLPTPAVLNYRATEGYGEIGRPRTIDGLRVREFSSFGSDAAVYWITPSSHLVVRIASTPTSAGQFDFQWHTPTKSNDKLLALAIPRGFKHFVPKPLGHLPSTPNNLG